MAARRIHSLADMLREERVRGMGKDALARIGIAAHSAEADPDLPDKFNFNHS